MNECQGAQSDEAIDMPEEDDLANDEGENDDLICFVCLKGDVCDDNDIVICDGTTESHAVAINLPPAPFADIF